MPQPTENKQNEPILIANFEPAACAGNAAQKVERLFYSVGDDVSVGGFPHDSGNFSGCVAQENILSAGATLEKSVLGVRQVLDRSGFVRSALHQAVAVSSEVDGEMGTDFVVADVVVVNRSVYLCGDA